MGERATDIETLEERRSARSAMYRVAAAFGFATLIAPVVLFPWFNPLIVEFVLFAVAGAFYIAYVLLDAFGPSRSSRRDSSKGRKNDT